MSSSIKLGEVFTISKGKKHSFSSINTKNSKRYIQIDDLRNNLNLKYTVDEKGVLATENDILIAWDGANAGTVGYSLNGFIGSTLAVLKTKNENVHTPYIAKYLQSKFLYLRRTATGATIPHLNGSILKNLIIPLPSYEEQKRIADMLDKIDEVRRKRRESIKLLDEYLKSVFLEMFGDPIENPLDWEKIKLGELSKIRRGASPRPIKDYIGGTVPWIKIGDGTKGNDIYIEQTSEKVTAEGAMKSVLLEKGALIFANCGVSLGFARILKISGCIHDGWLALENIDSRLNKIFLLKLLNSVTDYFRRTAPDGTQPNLNTSIMKEFRVPVPPIEQQIKFADIVKRVEKLKGKYIESEKEMENLFQAMMQKAFS